MVCFGIKGPDFQISHSCCYGNVTYIICMPYDFIVRACTNQRWHHVCYVMNLSACSAIYVLPAADSILSKEKMYSSFFVLPFYVSVCCCVFIYFSMCV